MSQRYFITAEATYESLRTGLNKTLGYPNPQWKTVFTPPLQAPRDGYRRVLLAVDTTLPGYDKIDAALVPLLDSAAVEEITASEYADALLQSNSYATLVDGRVPAEQLPSYVDDVLEYADLAHLPGSGEHGIIYVTLDTNKVYRWSGTTYIEVSAGASAWGDITDKPATFPPSAHDHGTITNDGHCGTVAGQILVTGFGGLIGTAAALSTTQVTTETTYTNFLPEGGDLATALSGIDSALTGRVPVTASWGDSDLNGSMTFGNTSITLGRHYEPGISDASLTASLAESGGATVATVALWVSTNSVTTSTTITNGGVSIAATDDINETSNTLQLSATGITFPDASVQTVAWPGSLTYSDVGAAAALHAHGAADVTVTHGTASFTLSGGDIPSFLYGLSEGDYGHIFYLVSSTFDNYYARLESDPQFNLCTVATLQFSDATTQTTAAKVSKSFAKFTPADNQPPATNFATLDTRNSVLVLEFDAATDESAVFVGYIPEGVTLTNGLKVRISWMADTATSGNVRWGVQFEADGTDLDADSFDTATLATSAANGTSGIETVATITATSIDSLAAGDRFRLKVYRDADDATNDTMTGDAQLVAVEVQVA